DGSRPTSRPIPRPTPAVVSAEALALEAQAGSVQAFEALVARFEAPLLRFLFLRTRDAAAAEDLTQEAFLRAWKNLARYDPRWRFSTWLYTVAERLCISARRSRGKDPAMSVLEPEQIGARGTPDPAQAAADKD